MMRKTIRLTATALYLGGLTLALTTPAQADWISDKLSDSCSGASAQKLSQSIRDNIEDSMDRAEASIKPPSPVGDLGCLEDLMSDVGINIFSAEQGGDFGGSMASGLVQQLMGPLTDQLQGAGLGDLLDAAGDPMGAVCKFAEDKWNELSGSLGGGDLKIPPDLGQAFNLGSFNLPSSSSASTPSSAPGSSTQPFADIARGTTGSDDPLSEDLTQEEIDEMWRNLTANQ
jgi:hypothetical protein